MNAIGWGLDEAHGLLVWFQTLAPHGFGLYLIPLIVLGICALLAARRAT